MEQVKNKVENWQIGSDIEFFLQDKETGKFVTAEGIIKGDKHDPYHFDKKNHFFATSLDCVLAEGNIPPAKNSYQFYRNVKKLINYINSTLPTNLQTVAKASVRMDEDQLQSETAKVAGCSVSYNCWDGSIISPNFDGSNLRPSGFHIHVGYDNPSRQTNLDLGKAYDLFINIPAVLIEPKSERKQSGYGQAGNIRHQRHGFEGRSLSSYFASDRTLIEWAFKNTKAAIDFVNSGANIDHLADIIQNTINTEDKKTARKLIKQFNIKMP
jgi:phiEco32-like amidoligase-type 2 protein